MKHLLMIILLILILKPLCYCKEIQLTFTQCLKLALKNSDLIKGSKLKYKQIQEELALVRSKKYPRLYLNSYEGVAQFRGGIPIN
ncbi:hypothetical protein KKF73_04740, partial [Patescibacteria group bacterium]|nr:hypothetical protein [Patescibacteria group bacterium]